MSKQTITVEQLRSAIAAAQITRGHEHVGQFSQGTGDEWDPETHFEGYCVLQRVSIDGLEFYAQTAIEVPAEKPADAAFNHRTGWEPYVIDSCSLVAVDADGDEIDMLDAIDWAIDPGQGRTARLDVGDWTLQDWPEVVPAENPAVSPDSDSADVPSDSTPAIDEACADDFDYHFVARDHQRNLRFTGWSLAFVSSRGHNSTRWTEITAYRTTGGRYIVATVGRTQREGETDRCAAEIVETLDALADAVGHGSLGKHMQAELGIDASLVID